MGLTAQMKTDYSFALTSGDLSAGEGINRGSSPPVGDLSWLDGTGSGQANSLFKPDFSIPATSFQLYDLKGGNGELDALNVLLAMTAVKGIYIEITTPGSTKSLRFGPQAQTNAALLWFQAATANFYDTILDQFHTGDRTAGWALDGTHKVIALYNPSAVTVAGKLRVVGTK